MLGGINTTSGEMVKAFREDWEVYQPTSSSVKLHLENGEGSSSYQNLNILHGKGLVVRSIERRLSGVMLITFTDSQTYLATGFKIGVMSHGAYWLSRFLEDCGFGNSDELYEKIS